MIEIAESSELEPPLSLNAFAKVWSDAGIEKNGADSSLKEFRKRVYPSVSDREWDDWRWQIANRVKDVGTIEKIIGDSMAGAMLLNKGLPAAVTPYYLGVVASSGTAGLRRCIEPTVHEFMADTNESVDPLGEEGHMVAPGLVHRYPDRVLFLVTDYCSTYCRYCTRSRLVGKTGRPHSMKKWKSAIAYIKRTPVIRDVLLSGGDPLTLPDEKLDWLLTELRAIPHVEIVRIGTKVPAVLPQRITPELVAMLRKHHPLFMSLHFTHPDELTAETAKACAMLADAGIPLGSQTVLLKDVNDDVDTMKKLMQGLLKVRVRPYYLYQCDPIPGSAHFRTRVEKGLEIIQGLRGHTSGYAVPNYVIDAPGGGGKIPLLPEYYVGRDEKGVLLRNYEGNIYNYPDPEPNAEACLGSLRA
ncbi:KamA family radical SAM protein [Maridesulfovibrio ferrireducens]|uniref:KamA family radical SAM protein n=1 Tax=Maridesulfovibrio ferrireducens TaxID=246191 RepID=UPI001A338262|nr:KamA family radical SAM protein [Maridesulfovibrio ferrireducens]MBI9112174.1 KamA family radical SAM protein [Maridesulfovibrio ferrireducens]